MWGLISSCDESGLLFIAVQGLLIVVASLVAGHGPLVCGLQLHPMASVVMVPLEHRLSSCAGA